ncbi:MAG: DUF2946 family protein [Rhodocyclales bacterium]|nr:DUF2946 family protein [Rhodocyclales bacterium]
MADFSAIAKWPNVPACYEWLSLDRRGDWRLQGERVTHRGLIEFLNKQYASDESGHWFVQNGPQRVYVDLACTPWIFRYQDGDFLSHTGLAAGKLRALYLDADGNCLIDSELGFGLLNDRDLAQLLAECLDNAGKAIADEDFLALMQGEPREIFWRATPLQAIFTVDLEKQWNFIQHPRP